MAEFQVKLEGIKLSKESTARIQDGIQRLVIHELAGLDYKGDLVIARPIKIGPLINGIIAKLAAGKIQMAGINHWRMQSSPVTDTIPTLCPSARCQEKAILLGVIQQDGSVSFLAERMKVDQFFVELAHQGRTPEKRFRFADTCLKCGCQQWTGSRCGVIDRLMADNPEFRAALPSCSIRSDCRWYQQHGTNACAICPQVVTDLTEHGNRSKHPIVHPNTAVRHPEFALWEKRQMRK
jgi:hypothetical protein